MPEVDVAVLGAGAAGLMCAIEAGRRGRRVVVVDHAQKPGPKIRISGGGRCNFTNLHCAPDRFLSQNPRFCISALRGFTQHDFIQRVDEAGIPHHEKTLGQLFCDRSSQDIIDMLVRHCTDAGVQLRLGTAVTGVTKTTDGYRVEGPGVECARVVVATGGKSVPKMGATGVGYSIAQAFGHSIVETAAGLVPFTFDDARRARMKHLSGVSLPATAKVGKRSFDEALLFTHRGLSGPVVLQISSYWTPGQEVEFNLCPDTNMTAALQQAKSSHPKQSLHAHLAQRLPKRVATWITEELGIDGRLGELSSKALGAVADHVNRWRVVPAGTEGYRTAEVTVGGVDTREVSSKTFESKHAPGLYFVGEVLDVTGWLGGYNFQWAWSSGYAAGQVV